DPAHHGTRPSRGKRACNPRMRGHRPTCGDCRNRAGESVFWPLGSCGSRRQDLPFPAATRPAEGRLMTTPTPRAPWRVLALAASTAIAALVSAPAYADFESGLEAGR